MQARERGVDAVGRAEQACGVPPSAQTGATAVSSSLRRSNTSTTVGRTNSMSGSSSVLCGRGQLFDQADGFIAEIADQAGQRGRQAFGHVDPAAFDQRAQFGQAVARQRAKGGAVGLPCALISRFRPWRGTPDRDRARAGCSARALRHPAPIRAGNRRVRHDQLARGADRGFAVGDQLAPDQRRLSGRQRGEGRCAVFGQGAGWRGTRQDRGHGLTGYRQAWR
jgi:hypothetical protein